MILSEIRYLIKEIVRNAYLVDDERIDDRLVDEFIRLKRSQFIVDSLNKGRPFEENTLQDLYVNFEAVDTVKESTGYTNIRNVSRTTTKLPKLLEYRDGVTILEVSSSDYYANDFTLVSFDRLRFAGSGKYNKNLNYVSFRDDKLYLKSGGFAINNYLYKALDSAVVRAVLYNPEDDPNFNVIADPYPINTRMIEFIKNAIIDTDINIILKTKSDDDNNSEGIIK